MKSVLITLLVATALVACGKKEQPVAPAPAATPAAQPAAPAASEPAKTEEVKK